MENYWRFIYSKDIAEIKFIFMMFIHFDNISIRSDFNTIFMDRFLKKNVQIANRTSVKLCNMSPTSIKIRRSLILITTHNLIR